MDIKNITSESLRRILRLIDQKDNLLKAVTEVENEMAKVLGGTVGTVAGVFGVAAASAKPAGVKPTGVKPRKQKRTVSPEGRARMAAAQKARWAAKRAGKSA